MSMDERDPQPVPKFPLINRLALWVARPSCGLFMKLLYRIRFDGYEQIPRRGPLIIVSNHQSHYDPILVGLLIRHRPFRPMARLTLYRSKLLAAVMRAFRTIAIDQTKGDRAAIKAAINVVNEGDALIIFPEGSRTFDGATQPFKRGLLVVLKKTTAPILPVAVEGAFDIWPRIRGRPRLYGRLAVRAGTLISHEEIMQRDPEDLIELLRRRIESMRIDLRREMRARSHARFPIERNGDQPFWDRPDTVAKEHDDHP